MWTRIFCFFAKRGQHLQPFNYIWRQTNIKQKDKTMKKLLLLFAAVLTLTSCHTKAKRSYGPEITSVRHARPFEKIQVKGACDVKFAQGDAFSVKVVGADELVKDVVTQFSGTTLTISMKDKHQKFMTFKRKHMPVVYVTSPDLIAIRMEGAGDFEIDGPLDTDTLNVFLKGVGDIELKRVVCDEFYGTLLGTGDIDVDELTAAYSEIRLKGVGDVDVNFVNSGTAVCTLQGVGDVELSGTLQSLQKEVKGTGDIQTKDLKLGK
jgi:hypothetical protein